LKNSKDFSNFLHKFSLRIFFLEKFRILKNNKICAEAAKALWYASLSNLYMLNCGQMVWNKIEVLLGMS
jgi:hypothetical protein